MSNSSVIRTSLFRKIIMALTGLFLCFFLVIHLAGNFQLLLPEEVAHGQYNWYSHTLSKNILIKLVSYVLYVSLLIHMLDSLWITLKNRKSNGPSYNYDKRWKVSNWNSRNMGWLGLLILVFLVVHLKDFWYPYKFGEVPMYEGEKDLYIVVMTAFQETWIVVLYVIAMIGLYFHLSHGFSSAFRTLGVYHEKYSRWIRYFGIAFSFLMALGFAVIPLIVYFKIL